MPGWFKIIRIRLPELQTFLSIMLSDGEWSDIFQQGRSMGDRNVQLQ